jgi:hypothetical protein
MSLFSTSGLATQERRAARKLLTAFEESRKRHTINLHHRQLLAYGARAHLGAVNPHARILWGKAVCDQVEQFFALDEGHPYSSVPLFFVTLSDVACITDHDAPLIDIAAFRRRLQRGLKGLSYVGMIEPALYVNVASGSRLSSKKAVSWHLHAICWGADDREMRRRFRRLNREGLYRSVMESQRGAHQKSIPNACLVHHPHRTFLADKLRYLLKSPKCAYRVYRTERVTKYGECVACFRQRKSQLRHGDRITLFHLMKDQHLDELAVAGGKGTRIMRRIKASSSLD